jgi:hypothetical protein
MDREHTFDILRQFANHGEHAGTSLEDFARADFMAFSRLSTQMERSMREATKITNRVIAPTINRQVGDRVRFYTAIGEVEATIRCIKHPGYYTVTLPSGYTRDIEEREIAPF